jgi:hypothetical protein
MKTIIFSKNRAMQLDLCLHSISYFCDTSLDIDVIYKTTTYAHEDSYEALKYIYSNVSFHKDKDFKSTLLDVIGNKNNILFLVDDNVFVNNFSVKTINNLLETNLHTLGFSLRLGRNTTMCYPLSRSQALPQFYRITDDSLMYRWVNADYDFGYPLELSSSVYRVKDILPILQNCEYNTPNTLEAILDLNKNYFREEKNLLLCYEQSVAFCNPINRVQTFNNNKAGINPEYSSDSLLTKFEKHGRIAIEPFENFVPTGAHQEVEIKIVYSS